MAKSDVCVSASTVGSSTSLASNNGVTPAAATAAELAMFRSLADCSQEFIGMCDLQFKPFYVNEAGRKLVGLDSMEEACAVTVQDFFFPEDRPFITREFLPKVLRDGAAEVEIRFRHFKTSAPFWMIYNVFQVPDAHGRPRGYATVSRDITERKRAEEGLQRELERGRLLHKLSTELIQAADVEALYEKILDTAVAVMHSDFASLQMLESGHGERGHLRLLGSRGFSPRAASFWEWVSPDSGSACGIALRTRERVFVADVRECQLMQSSADLATYLEMGVVAVQTTPLMSRSGELLGMISTHWRTVHQPTQAELRAMDVLARQAADLLERRLAEKALHESGRRLRLLTDNAPVMLGHWDTQHRFKFANAAYTARFGLTPDQVVGKHLREVVGEQAYKSIQPLIDKGLREEYADFEVQISYFQRDPQWLHVIYTRELGPGGKVLGVIAAIQDITRRKEAEDALRLREAALKEAQRLAHVGSWTWDARTDEGTASDEMLRIYGFDPATQTIPRFADQSGLWYPPGEWERLSALAKKAIETGEGYELELQALRKGEPIWIFARAEAVRDATNRIVGLRGTVQDITERRRAEEALRRSEAKLRAVIEEAPLAMVLTGPSGEILLRNPRFDQLWGRPPHLTTAGTYSDVYEGYHLDGRRIESEEWPGARSVLKGEVIDNQVYEIVQASRRRITCWFGSAPIRNTSGQILGAVVVFRDISRERQIEEALRESERRLTLAQQAGGVGVYDWNVITGEVVWTSQLEKLYGIEASQARDKHALWLEHVHPDDRQKLVDGTREWLESSVNEQRWEYRFTRPDGQQRWLSGQSLAIRDPAGRPLRVIGTNTDINEQKSFQAELERLVAERTARLHEIVGELEHFSYTITHDMRAPLRAMRGFAEAIQELCSEKPQPELQIFLRRLMQGAERMDLLITDALQYTKAVRQEVPLGPVDLGLLLRGMLETYPGFIDADITLQEPVLPVSETKLP